MKINLQPSIKSIGLLKQIKPSISHERSSNIFPSFRDKPSTFRALELIAEITGSTVSMGYLGGVVYRPGQVAKKLAMLTLYEEGLIVRQRERMILTRDFYPILFTNEERKEDFIVASLLWHKGNSRKIKENKHYSVINMALYNGTHRIQVNSISHFMELTELTTLNIPIFLNLGNPHFQSAPFFEFYTTQLTDDFWIT